jgi:hypothetical protein
MALKINMIASITVIFSTEEVIETNFVQTGRTCKSREVSTDTFGMFVGAHHHRCGIPTNEGANATFDVFIAREPWLVFARNGVDIRS